LGLQDGPVSGTAGRELDLRHRHVLALLRGGDRPVDDSLTLLLRHVRALGLREQYAALGPSLGGFGVVLCLLLCQRRRPVPGVGRLGRCDEAGNRNDADDHRHRDGGDEEPSRRLSRRPRHGGSSPVGTVVYGDSAPDITPSGLLVRSINAGNRSHRFSITRAGGTRVTRCYRGTASGYSGKVT